MAKRTIERLPKGVTFDYHDIFGSDIYHGRTRRYMVATSSKGIRVITSEPIREE